MATSAELEKVGRRIDEQERRLRQRDLSELQEQCTEAKRRQTEIQHMLSIEQARCKTQETEIGRRRRQLEESGDLIKRLQSELEEARSVASGVKWELRENELRSMNEAEIIHYRSINSGLEARLKRKQAEVELAHQLVKSVREQAEKETSALKLSLLSKEATLLEAKTQAQRLAREMKGIEQRQQLECLGEKIGTLTASNISLKAQVDALQKEKADFEERLQQNEEERSSLQAKIDALNSELNHSVGTNQLANKYLSEELEKCKHQKAALRCEHLQLKRDYARLNVDLKLSKAKEATSDNDENESEIQRLKAKNERQEKEKEALVQKYEKLVGEGQIAVGVIAELKQKLEHSESLLQESEACSNARVAQMSADLEENKNSTKALREALVELDNQCENLLVKLRGMEVERGETVLENQALHNEVATLKQKVDAQTRLEAELRLSREEEARLRSRMEYLERELAESHRDHRSELERLSQQLVAKSEDAQRCDTATSSKLNSLASQLRLQESECRSLQRKLEQTVKEAESSVKEIAEARKHQCELVNENTKLRQMLSDAITKAEGYKSQTDHLRRQIEATPAKTACDESKMLKMEDELLQLREELERKEKLVSYLQSVVQPKQMQKLRHVSHSTLISTDTTASSVQGFEVEERQCAELEEQRNELKRKLQQKKRLLVEKKLEAVPLIKQNLALGRAVEMPAEPSSIGKIINTTTAAHSPATPLRPGIMRHDIPHKWKKQFIAITTARCAGCMDGLPHFGHVLKCRECGLQVHLKCQLRVVNTCGLPEACASFYLDAAHPAMWGDSSSMTGWVKLWRSDYTSDVQWRSAWAKIDTSNSLCFFDSDGMANAENSPFMRIDLENERWKIYNQPGQVQGIAQESIPLLVEIKLKNSTLYLLAPTAQARQRWVHALQQATNRRICADIQRRPSTAGVENTLLLALSAPQNLAINCTQVVDYDWLLLGTQEGLFATNWAQPRAPFNIANVPTLYYMELLPEHDMLVAVCGPNRRLVAIHLQQLKRALSADYHPSVLCTPLSNVENINLAVVSLAEDSGKRFIYLAAARSIHVLQFVEKLGAFSALSELRTIEPCTCICSTPFGFIFGADAFYFVKFDAARGEFGNSKRLAIDGCTSDFPVACLAISKEEYLLAFSNYGTFVSHEGLRSRKENVEWEMVPQEFAYDAPYLYIVYAEFLEICKVAPYTGPDSSTLLPEQKSMYKCQRAHRTGLSARPSPGITFAISSEERTELHVFTSIVAGDNSQEKSSLKRKLVNTIATAPSTRKRQC